jgi:hypothetical protein
MKHPLERPTPLKIRAKYRYICNGKFFETYGLAESYANANGWQINGTEEIKGKILIHVNGTN